MLHRVYIDESGERGRAPGSSAHFVLSAVVVADSDVSRARSELAAMALQLGRQPGQVLHFRKLTHSEKVKASQEVAGASSIACVTSVILCKAQIQQPYPGGGVSFISRADPMYLWGVRLLLERVSWYLRDSAGGGPAIVTFAHITRFKTHKLHNYRQALQNSDTQVHWPAFDGHPFRLDHPNKEELLQLADTTASALFKAVEPDQYGNTEARYLSELAPSIYRRTGHVTSYGLKVYPSAEGEPGGSLTWLRRFD